MSGDAVSKISLAVSLAGEAQMAIFRACLQALRRGAISHDAVLFQPILSNTICHLNKSFDPNVWPSDSASHDLLHAPKHDRRWMSSGRFSDDEQPSPVWLSEGSIDGDGGEREAVEEVEEEEGAEVPERAPSALDLMLEGVPRRRQRFIMQKALKLKSEGEDEERASRRGFEMKLIDVNRTVKVTKGGKVQSFAALVITGNYNGVVGFGKGKSSEIGPAIDKASLRALNNLHYFDRFQGHTIFHEHDSKFEKTKVYLWPGRSGTGMRASRTVGGILRLAGYQNVKSKVVGSRHPLNTVKAVFKTLSEIESPEEVGERRSRIVVESHLLPDSA